MRKNNFINAVLDCLTRFQEFVIVFVLLASKHNLLFFLPALFKIKDKGAFVYVVDFVCVKCVCVKCVCIILLFSSQTVFSVVCLL